MALPYGPHATTRPPICQLFRFDPIAFHFTLSKGKLVWDDEQLVIRLIKKHFKDQADILIRTTEEPNKEALRQLPAEDLAKLGCSIEGAGDQAIVKRVAGEVEKLINKLIEKLVEAMVEE